MLIMLMNNGRYNPLSRLRPDVPAGVDELLANCLATDREQRLGSAQEFLEELRRIARQVSSSEQAGESAGKVVAHQTVDVGPASASEPSAWLSHQTVAPASTKRGY